MSRINPYRWIVALVKADYHSFMNNYSLTFLGGKYEIRLWKPVMHRRKIELIDWSKGWKK